MRNVIKCPHCQAEYMAAEIFLPDSFLGHPREIQKDLNGKIMGFFGKDMDLIESYRCDYCNRKFTVTANVNFKTDSKTKDLKKVYSTKINKPSLFLDEG